MSVSEHSDDEFKDITFHFARAHELLSALHPTAQRPPCAGGPIDDEGWWAGNLRGEQAAAGARNWLFRGMSFSTWNGLPSAWRKDSLCHRWVGRDPFSVREMCLAEALVAREFFLKADAQAIAIPGDGPALRAKMDGREPALLIEVTEASGEKKLHWPDDTLVPLLAVVQHNLSSTRLLDWSRRPLVAAWFAAEGCVTGKKDENLVIWAANRRSPLGHGDLFKNAGLTLTSAPRAGNHNLHLQSGMLSYRKEDHPSSEAEKRDWSLNGGTTDGQPDDSRDQLRAMFKALDGADAKNYLRRLTLPQSEAPALLALLSAEFVHGATVYSGYHGVSQAVKLDIWAGRKKQNT